MGSMNLAAPGHLLQRFRVNSQQACSLFAIEQGLKLSGTKLNRSCQVVKKCGGNVRHFDLLMAQSCPCFPRVSKTFYGKVDAAEASTRNGAELLRQDGSDRENRGGFGTYSCEQNLGNNLMI
jgi:hypothetical protein